MGRPRTCASLLLALVVCACSSSDDSSASDAQGESESSSSSASSDTAPSSSADWGDSLEEEESGDEACEDCPDPEGRPCVSLYQDCGEGLKCVPYWLAEDVGGAPTDYKCVRVEGELGAGSACTLDDLEAAIDDCDQGSFCWTWGGELPGRCQALCTGGFQYADCIEGWTCALPDDDPPMCVEPCDPLADPNETCPAGTQCVGSSYGDICTVAGPGLALGEACAQLNDCAPALTCADAATLTACTDASCCAALCSLAQGDEPCAAIDPGYVCAPRSNDPEELVGVCQLPD